VVPLAAFRAAHGGEGGEVNASTPVFQEATANLGAAVMGRGMFGPIGGGDWGDEKWTGWWGDNPPYHYPVFVLTHHKRDPVEMAGGTTYHFVTDGIAAALEQAKAAGLLDELELHVVPMLLGGGSRPFADLASTGVRLEQVRAVHAPGVTHLKYRTVAS